MDLNGRKLENVIIRMAFFCNTYGLLQVSTLAMHTQATVHGKPMLVQEQLLWHANFLHPHAVALVDWLVLGLSS